MSVQSMADLDLSGKRVVIRQDLNTPLKDGAIADDNRIKASLPTVKLALEKGAAVVLISHLGKPTEGEFNDKFSLAPVAARLSAELGFPVPLVKDWTGGVEVIPGQVVLCENVRFEKGEKKNSPELGAKIAALGDVFVQDGFAVAHRAQASTEAAFVAAKAAGKPVCAGPLLAAELDALAKALDKPARPMVAIVGGSKVSTKLLILKNLIGKTDQLIPGGGIANTFLVAAGKNVGKSLVEADLVDAAKEMLEAAKAAGKSIPLPEDVVVSTELSESARPILKMIDEVGPEDIILDIGPRTAKAYAELCKNAGTVLWNGPVGVFEIDQFAGGTKVLAYTIADAKNFSIAGGGDTVAALAKYHLTDLFSYISTGGGAFLEFLEGKVLPAVAVLEG